MGMENGLLYDTMITVSSSAPDSDPSLARLHSLPEGGKTGGWVPNKADKTPFVEVDFQQPRNLSAVVTQGREDADEWTTGFKVVASNDSETWEPVRTRDGEELFPGNTDRSTSVTNYFEETVPAQYLKVVPVTWNERPALRMEVLGCYHPYEECVEFGPWLSLSVPTLSNKGDIEPIRDIVQKSAACSNPIGIECREYSSKQSYNTLRQRVTCDLTNGLQCLHADQNGGYCLNYEVRIKCYTCVSSTPPEEWTTPPPVAPCPELNSSEAAGCPNACPVGYVCDGHSCVDPLDCPCVRDGKHFKPGDQLETEQCDVCECQLEGHSRCRPKTCPPCDKGQKSVLLGNCTCECEGCETGSALCPTSGECVPVEKWCDGIIDCPDDEANCTTPAPSTTACPPPVEPDCPEEHVSVLVPNNETHCPEYMCVSFTTEVPVTTTVATLAPLQVENATCELLGRHITTLDGHELEYDICHHVALQDIVDNKFNVAVHKDCSPSKSAKSTKTSKSSKCRQWVEIQQDGHTLVIGSDLDIRFDGHQYTASQLTLINKRAADFTIEVVGQQVVFKSLSHGFTAVYDTRANLRVGVTPDLMQRVAGLCGFYSGSPSDDRRMPNGGQASSNQEFGDSWAVNNTDKCVPSTCPSSLVTKAMKACSKLREAPFDQCKDVVSLQSHMTACLATVCDCLQKPGSTLSQCSCDAYLPMIQACENKLGHPLRGWRIKHGCVPDCPPGLEWDDCGPTCQLTCDNLDMDQTDCNKECVPGCFCPPGTVQDGDNCKAPEHCSDLVCQGFGDPHLETFDGWYFPFQSTGSFILASDKGRNFKVQGVSKECSPGASIACMVGLKVFYDGHSIAINKGQPLQIDDEVVPLEELPQDVGGLAVMGFPGQTILIFIPSLDVQIRYYELNSGFAIRVPSKRFFNNTVGLCGNCNRKKNDDSRNKNGKVSTVSDFVCSWLTEGDVEKCVTSYDELPVVEEPVPACDALKDDTFAVCHPLIDPELFVKACSFDAVHSKDETGAMCKSLMEYARQCCQVGVDIENWMEKFGCSMSCPVGLNYSQCHSACPQTCDNHKHPLAVDCNDWKVDGCFCPDDKVLIDGECVDPVLCETCDDEGHRPGDTWSEEACSKCQCSANLRVDCKEEVCPQPPICRMEETLTTVPAANGSCCNNYLCTEGPTPTSCPPMVVPKCAPGEVAKVRKSNASCQVFECVCDPALCPLISWPSDLQPGQDTEIVKTGCCSKVTVVCKPETCPDPPTCAPGMELKELPGDCCSVFRCKPPADICLYTPEYEIDEGFQVPVEETQEAVTYKPGQQWRDGLCKNCTCEGSPGQYTPRCVMEQCPLIQELPDDRDYVLHHLEVPGKCCPELVRFYCKDEDGNVRDATEEWQSTTDPCLSYTCELTPLGDVQKVKRSTVCPDCPKTSEYIPPSKKLGQCCGICRPNKCEDAGVLHAIGETWDSATHPCYTAECVREAGSLRTIYTSPSCPALPDKCPTENIVWDEKHCCQECNVSFSLLHCNTAPVPLNETVGFFAHFDMSHGGLCLNKDPVPGVVECAGACESHSYYSLDKNQFTNICKCCKVKVWVNKTVDLVCRDGTKVTKFFKQPSACECSKCGGDTGAARIKGKQPQTQEQWGQEPGWGSYDRYEMQQEQGQQDAVNQEEQELEALRQQQSGFQTQQQSGFQEQQQSGFQEQQQSGFQEQQQSDFQSQQQEQLDRMKQQQEEMIAQHERTVQQQQQDQLEMLKQLQQQQEAINKQQKPPPLSR